jgi:hypothetical protein
MSAASAHKGRTECLVSQGRLAQHRHLETAWPQSVQQDPEQAVDRERPGPNRSLAAENVHLITEGDVLLFHNRPTTEPATNNRVKDRSRLSTPAVRGSPRASEFTSFVGIAMKPGYRKALETANEFARIRFCEAIDPSPQTRISVATTQFLLSFG